MLTNVKECSKQASWPLNYPSVKPLLVSLDRANCSETRLMYPLVRPARQRERLL
jgi:hypothetical protein